MERSQERMGPHQANRATFVGYFYNLVENDHLHVSAELIEDSIYGPEWQIYLYERVTPGTLEEMKKFLTSIKGVGPVAAQKLLDAFGLDVISTVLDDATCLNTLSLPAAGQGCFVSGNRRQSGI